MTGAFISSTWDEHFAEYLATICDRMLKKGGEKLLENQVEQRLENIVSHGGGGGRGGGRSMPEIPPIQN